MCCYLCPNQHALVPNLDFDSGAALNKLWAPSHDWNSANAWQSFLFCIIHLDSRIMFHPHQRWHLPVWGQTSADGSRTDGQVYSCLQPLSTMIVSDICCQSDSRTQAGITKWAICARTSSVFFRYSSVLLIMRSQSTSMMLEKGFSRYPWRISMFVCGLRAAVSVLPDADLFWGHVGTVCRR